MLKEGSSVTEKIVLVTDYTWSSTEPEAKVLAKAGARVLLAETGNEEELVKLVPQADAILTCFAHVTPRVVQAGQKLQVIGRYGIGVDNIAVDEATKLGIPVTNVPAYCLDEVSEHALAFFFALARHVCGYDAAVRAGNWDLKTGMPMFRMSGRTLGILGFGKIGRALTAKARGLGLTVIAHHPSLPEAVFAQHQTESVSLDDLFTRSDFISVHLPLSAQTRHIVNRDLLRKMKPTSFLVNTSRGGVIDQTALILALQEGWIAGAGLDVFEPERLSHDHPLLNVPNLLTTPHVAFYSEESVAELEVKAAQNVADILSGRRPGTVLNPQVFELPRWAHLK
jgi:D-3-phosphoglycerate dehydrogenase